MPFGHLHIFSGKMSIQVYCTFLNFYLFVYFWLYLAFIARGLFSSCVSCACSLVVHWLLIVMAPLVVEHGRWGAQSLVAVACQLSSCSSWALNSCGVGA